VHALGDRQHDNSAEYYYNFRTYRSLTKDTPLHRSVERLSAVTSQPIIGGLQHNIAESNIRHTHTGLCPVGTTGIVKYRAESNGRRATVRSKNSNERKPSAQPVSA